MEFGIYKVMQENNRDFVLRVAEAKMVDLEHELMLEELDARKADENDKAEIAKLSAEYDSLIQGNQKDRSRARRRHNADRKAKRKAKRNLAKNWGCSENDPRFVELVSENNPCKLDKELSWWKKEKCFCHGIDGAWNSASHKAKEREQSMRQDWAENELVYKYDEPTPVDDDLDGFVEEESPSSILAAIKNRINLKQLLDCKEDWMQNIKVSRYDSDEVLFAGKIQNIYCDDNGNDAEEQNKELLDMIVVTHETNFDAAKEEGDKVMLNLFDLYLDVDVCTKAEYEEALKSLGEE